MDLNFDNRFIQQKGHQVICIKGPWKKTTGGGIGRIECWSWGWVVQGRIMGEKMGTIVIE